MQIVQLLLLQKTLDNGHINLIKGDLQAQSVCSRESLALHHHHHPLGRLAFPLQPIVVHFVVSRRRRKKKSESLACLLGMKL